MRTQRGLFIHFASALVLASTATACGGDDKKPANMADASTLPMAGTDATGGVGGTNATGGSGGGSGVGGSAASGGSSGTSGGSGGMGGTTPDDDGGVTEMADGGDEPEVVLPNDGEALSVCATTDDCNGDDLVCIQFGNFGGYCTDDCAEDADCPAVDGVASTCDADDRCVLDCAGDGEGDGECPENMECAGITPPFGATTYRCQYPEPKNLRVYEKCDSGRGDSDCREGLICRIPLLTEITLEYCAASCSDESDCGDQGTTGTPVCDVMPFETEGLCAIECEDDKDCPGDMTCWSVDLVTYRCGYLE